MIFGVAAADLRAESEKPAVPDTEKACLAAGGSWTTLGLPYPDKPKMCDLKTTDSGKSCEASDQCQGVCLAPKNAPEGSKAAGSCSTYLTEWGCYFVVEQNEVQRICVE